MSFKIACRATTCVTKKIGLKHIQSRIPYTVSFNHFFDFLLFLQKFRNRHWIDASSSLSAFSGSFLHIETHRSRTLRLGCALRPRVLAPLRPQGNFRSVRGGELSTALSLAGTWEPPDQLDLTKEYLLFPLLFFILRGNYFEFSVARVGFCFFRLLLGRIFATSFSGADSASRAEAHAAAVAIPSPGD